MSRELKLLYLSDEDVEAAGGSDMKLAIESCEEALRASEEGRSIIPARAYLRLDEEERGRIVVLPYYVGPKAFGILWLAGFSGNPAKFGLPRAMGFFALHDPSTGVPLAILDAMIFNRTGTGAITAIGAKHLARRDSEVVAIIGTGNIARGVLAGLKEVLLNIKDVRAYDVRKEAAEKYAEEMNKSLKLRIRVVETAEDAVRGADVIVTATTSNQPIVKNGWIKNGTFFSHVGSWHEAEYDVVTNSDKVVTNNWEADKAQGITTLALMHAQRLFKDEDVYAELSEIVTGKKPGRENFLPSQGDKRRNYCSSIRCLPNRKTKGYRHQFKGVKV